MKLLGLTVFIAAQFAFGFHTRSVKEDVGLFWNYFNRSITVGEETFSKSRIEGTINYERFVSVTFKGETFKAYTNTWGQLNCFETTSYKSYDQKAFYAYKKKDKMYVIPLHKSSWEKRSCYNINIGGIAQRFHYNLKDEWLVDTQAQSLTIDGIQIPPSFLKMMELAKLGFAPVPIVEVDTLKQKVAFFNDPGLIRVTYKGVRQDISLDSGMLPVCLEQKGIKEPLQFFWVRKDQYKREINLRTIDKDLEKDTYKFARKNFQHTDQFDEDPSKYFTNESCNHWEKREDTLYSWITETLENEDGSLFDPTQYILTSKKKYRYKGKEYPFSPLLKRLLMQVESGLTEAAPIKPDEFFKKCFVPYDGSVAEGTVIAGDPDLCPQKYTVYNEMNNLDITVKYGMGFSAHVYKHWLESNPTNAAFKTEFEKEIKEPNMTIGELYDGYSVVFMPGFFQFPESDRLQFVYDFCENNGIDWVRTHHGPARDIPANADILFAEIKRKVVDEKKKVLLMTVSKGTIEGIFALAKYKDEIESWKNDPSVGEVSGFVNMSGVVSGSFIIDFLDGTFLGIGYDRALKILQDDLKRKGTEIPDDDFEWAGLYQMRSEWMRDEVFPRVEAAWPSWIPIFNLIGVTTDHGLSFDNDMGKLQTALTKKFLTKFYTADGKRTFSGIHPSNDAFVVYPGTSIPKSWGSHVFDYSVDRASHAIVDGRVGKLRLKREKDQKLFVRAALSAAMKKIKSLE